MRETGNHLWGDGIGWSKKHLVYPVGCGWLGPCSPSKVVLPPSTVLVGASLDMFKYWLARIFLERDSVVNNDFEFEVA
jgi:hypothetical protein